MWLPGIGRSINTSLESFERALRALFPLGQHSATILLQPWEPLSLSTNGIAFVSDRDGSSEIYSIQADGSGLARLTESPAIDADPDWSPEGQVFALNSDRFPAAAECQGGVHRLALFPSGGRRDDIRLLDIHPEQQETFAWSPVP